MELAANSQEPWVDWVKDRRHVFDLLALTVKMRITGGLQPATTLGNNVDRPLHPVTGYSCQYDGQNGFSGINSLSSHQQDQVLRDFTQQMPPRRALSSKGQLYEQFHFAQSVGDSKVPKFVPSSKVFSYGEIPHTKIQVNVEKNQDFTDRMNHQFINSASTVQVLESSYEKDGRISRIGDTERQFAVSADNLELIRSTPGPFSGILESQKLTKCDRPIISWLNKPKETRAQKMDIRSFRKRKIMSRLEVEDTQITNEFGNERKLDLAFHVLFLEEEEVRPSTGSLKEVSDSEFPRPSAQLHDDGLLEDSQWSEGYADLLPPNQISDSCTVDVDNSTLLSQDNTEVVKDDLKSRDLLSCCSDDVDNLTGASEHNDDNVHWEPKKVNQCLDGCLPVPNELKEYVDDRLLHPSDLVKEDTTMIPKLVEMERLADRMVDSLVVDVTAEVAGICSLVVDNLIIGEFGHASVIG
ncbi:hypothetical protein R1sor_003514 [Riccia sorocarpa]|uniref:Uncharacterized protein n=1 Tax=Riccia sorocarpa TaxID=122646 RepID=A0ABD3H4S3_9MARC